MNVPNLGLKIFGADEALEKLDALNEKLREANSLIQELASLGVSIQINEIPADGSTSIPCQSDE